MMCLRLWSYITCDFAIDVAHKISSWATAEMSGLKNDYKSLHLERSGRVQQACKFLAFKPGGDRIVALPLSIVINSKL